MICHPIGIIRTPHLELENMPIQPSGAKGIEGQIEIFEEYIPGLEGLSGFSHIVLLYNLHKGKSPRLRVIPFLGDREQGVFATRAPCRPNPIGLSVVQLVSVKDNILTIQDVDMLDGTPLLDIKPFVPVLEDLSDLRTGWLEGITERLQPHKSDHRFRDE